jgi:hypothetical protein
MEDPYAGDPDKMREAAQAANPNAKPEDLEDILPQLAST